MNEQIFFDDSRHKNNYLFDYSILSDLDSIFCVHLSVGGCLMDFHKTGWPFIQIFQMYLPLWDWRKTWL